MPTGLIYSTRPLSGRFVVSLIQQFKVAETLCDKLDLLTTTKSSTNLDYVEGISGLSLTWKNYFNKQYEVFVKESANWEAVYEALDVSELLKYDHIFVFGGLLSDGSGLQRGTKRSTTFPVNDRHQLKFTSVGLPITCILAILKANREYGIPVHEMAYDPQEVSMNQFHTNFKPASNYTLYHGYDLDSYKMKRLDSLQYFNRTKPDLLTSADKTIDFVFGFTIITEDRLWLKDVADAVAKNFNTSKIFVHDKLTGESNFLDRDIYLGLIEKAKYTLIIPAYDQSAVSIYRIVESLELGCIPLFHHKVNVAHLEKSFGKIDPRLILPEDNSFTPFTNFERCDIIDSMKSKFCEFTVGFVR